MKKNFTPLMIFALIWLGIVMMSWLFFPSWSQIPGGFFTLAGLTAVGVIAFLKDGYSFIKDFIESRHIMDEDTKDIDNHDLFPDNDGQITNIRWSERDQALVSKYIDLCYAINPEFIESRAEAKFLQYCVSMGLARIVGGVIYLTQAGVLLFCKKQSFPHTKYHIDINFKDSENDLSKEFSSSVLESYFSTLELLSSFTVEWRDPTKRKKTGQESVFFFYPKTAIVEALVNFFIHRDYGNDDIGYITIYSDRIEFENPGQSLYPIDELIKATQPLKPQYKRNPRLVQAFRKTGLNQREGKGIIRIKQELEKNGSLREDGSLGLRIENVSTNDRFRLTIYKKISTATLKQREQVVGAMSQSTVAPQPALYQLPPPPADFTGRESLIAQLLEDIKLHKGATISGLTGMGGIGKTALGLVVAHGLAEKYPDAQIFLDLKGTTTPLTAKDIMRHVILSLEPTTDLRQLDDAGMFATYQSVLHGKNVLLYLDNARSAEQIAPLRPPATCAILVTSRWTFSVPGLQSRRVDVMNEQEAVSFLLELCPRINEKANELARACAYLPLALRIAGSFLQVNNDLSVEKYLLQLNDRKLRLEILKESREEAELSADADLLATFELSYNSLSARDRKRWQMLGVFSASFTSTSASAMWETDENETVKILGMFRRYNLIEFDETSGRYSLHDLLSDFALAHATESEQYSAQFRHSQFYLELLKLANQDYLQGGAGVLRGLSLFDLEWENIQKGQAWAAKNSTKSKDVAEICAEYPIGGAYCLELRLHPKQRITWLESSLEANQFIGKRKGEGISLGNLANAYAAIGEVSKAIEYYEQALTIDREIGDRRGEGTDLHNLGLAYYEIGDARKAIEFYELALNINQEIGDRRGEGAALGNLGNAFSALGDIQKAIDYYNQHLQIAQEIGDRRGESNALGNLGLSYSDLGDIRRSIEVYEQALKTNREIGDRRAESATFSNLGNAFSVFGEVHKAIEYYEQGLAIAQDIGDRKGESNILSNLGLAYSDLGDARKAIEFYEKALIIAHDTGDRRVEGNALGNLGLAWSNLGEHQKAIDLFNKALINHEIIGDIRGVGNAVGNLGSVYLAAGDSQKAIESFERALEIDRKIMDVRGMAIALTNLGSAFASLGNIAKAISYTQEALSIFENIESPYAIQTRAKLEKLREETSEAEIPETSSSKDLAESVGMSNQQVSQYSEVVPKSDMFAKYQVGQTVTGNIKKVIPAGLIVELEPGISGLVHISQVSYDFMTPEKLEKNFKIGAEVIVLINKIDTEKRQLSLSIKKA